MTVPEKQSSLLGREPLKFTNRRRLHGNCRKSKPHERGMQASSGMDAQMSAHGFIRAVAQKSRRKVSVGLKIPCVGLRVWVFQDINTLVEVLSNDFPLTVFVIVKPS